MVKIKENGKISEVKAENIEVLRLKFMKEDLMLVQLIIYMYQSFNNSNRISIRLLGLCTYKLHFFVMQSLCKCMTLLHTIDH